MDMVKLVKGNRTIERPKVDYENNIKIWETRGWELFVNKPKPEPKPEPKVDSEWQKDESFISVDSFNNKSTKHKKSKKAK